MPADAADTPDPIPRPGAHADADAVDDAHAVDDADDADDDDDDVNDVDEGVEPPDRMVALAARVGSDEVVHGLKRATMVVALGFLFVALGYFIGVRTTEPPGNEVDAGFLTDMTAHHDQAVLMAQSELAHGTDPVARDFAMEVILFQREELGRMASLKADLGVPEPPGDDDRESMAWMGMPTPVSAMPGMASEAQLDELDRARGTQADLAFLRLMQAHHQGGTHMADHAAEHAANPRIREMAARMAANQRVEVREYQARIDRIEAGTP